MLKSKEIRTESDEEITLKLENIKREIFELRSQRLDSKAKETHLIGQKRKEIARILTELKRRELERVS